MTRVSRTVTAFSNAVRAAAAGSPRAAFTAPSEVGGTQRLPANDCS